MRVIAAFMQGHGINDGLDFFEFFVGDLHLAGLFHELAGTWNQFQNGVAGAHLFNGLELVTEGFQGESLLTAAWLPWPRRFPCQWRLRLSQ